MIKFTKKDKRTNIEKEIDSLIEKLGRQKEGTEEFETTLKALERLSELRIKIAKKEGKLDRNVILQVIGSLMGIIIIVGYERFNVIASKALGFVIKGRV